MAKKKDILRDVRVIIGENESLQPLLEGGSTLLEPLLERGADDTALERDTLLATLIAPAIDKIHKIASGELTNNVSVLLENVIWNYDKYCQWCKLPDEVLKPTYVMVDNWDRPVVTFIENMGNAYDMCRSGIVGVMPTEMIPACALLPYSDGPSASVKLEAYPKEMDAKYRHIRYIPKADTGAKSDDYEYPIGTECYWAVIYTIASLYFLSVDDRQRSEDMDKQATEIITRIKQ